MIELARVKVHLRIDHDDEDVLIQGYLDAALVHVQMHCDRTLVEANPIGPEQMLLTKDVQQATLLLVGHWYANREAAGDKQIMSVPLGFERLLWYRKRF